MKMKLFITVCVMFLLSANSVFASFPVQTGSSNVQTTVNAEITSVSSPAAAAGGKSQIVATLLCFFIGGLGIHRFYLGYIWQGIVQILTLGGFFGLWVLIDLVRIIIGDLKPKDGNYDKTF